MNIHVDGYVHLHKSIGGKEVSEAEEVKRISEFISGGGLAPFRKLFGGVILTRSIFKVLPFAGVAHSVEFDHSRWIAQFETLLTSIAAVCAEVHLVGGNDRESWLSYVHNPPVLAGAASGSRSWKKWVYGALPPWERIGGVMLKNP